MKMLVNSCIRELDRKGVSVSRKSGAARPLDLAFSGNYIGEGVLFDTFIDERITSHFLFLIESKPKFCGIKLQFYF